MSGLAEFSVAALAVTVLTGVLSGAPGALAGPNAGEIALPAEKLKFEKLNPAISMADAYGNRAKGAHGTFGRFPGSFITPWHTHTVTYHGVVIKGTMTNPFKGENNPPQMGPGSYWHVPALSVHATACVSKTPCEFYFYADGPFDFTPVK